MRFEWDAEKARVNRRKHGVSFEEAKTVFDDPLAAIFDDEQHSGGEQREIIIGHSGDERLLLRGQPPGRNKETMKKAPTSASSEPAPDDLLPEYRFDYRKAKPNRFAGEGRRREISVILDEDVAEVFTTPESVNKALRALIEVVPKVKRLRR